MIRILTVTVFLLLTVSIHAQTQPAESQPAVNALLDRIEAVTNEIKTIRAKVRFDRIQLLQGDEQRRFGTMVYVAGPPARIKVHFTQLFVDRVPHPQDQQWIFDGEWLVERYNKKKQFNKRQIVAPNAKPEDRDPLGFGDGPFIVPIKANKKLLLKRFKVELIASTEKDPIKNSHHLRMTPKAGKSGQYDLIDVWYDSQSLLPVLAKARHAGSGNEDIFNLSKIKLDTPVKPGEISTAVPTQRGWEVRIMPYEADAPTTKPATSQPRSWQRIK